MQGNAHASTMPVGNWYGAMRVTFLSLARNPGVSDKLRQGVTPAQLNFSPASFAILRLSAISRRIMASISFGVSGAGSTP